MPVDAVLFGSRCMVAKEAATSLSVKELIVQAPGLIDESQVCLVTLLVLE
jgi:fatty acid synthase subunit beta, fungi type